MGRLALAGVAPLGEEQQEGDKQGEDAQRFRHGEAEDQAAELAVGGRGIAQRALQKLAEKIADADGGGSRADGGEAGADELGGGGIHGFLLPSGLDETMRQEPFDPMLVPRMKRVV